jgi:hypothetical protein
MNEHRTRSAADFSTAGAKLFMATLGGSISCGCGLAARTSRGTISFGVWNTGCGVAGSNFACSGSAQAAASGRNDGRGTNSVI